MKNTSKDCFIFVEEIGCMSERNFDDWIKKKRELKLRNSPERLFERISQGDVSALSSGITLVESQHPNHRVQANQLVKNCIQYTKKNDSIRIGITGVPGVGKSTFIEAFGKEITKRGLKLAVLAIDPSSSISKGSILGDKTRMNELSVREDVFIRPSPAGETLGGVAQRTRESIILCEAAGYDVILIETVGVGQSETVVKSMVDFFLLLMLSGAGDELQGIKKGIMEMADLLVITKADGDNILPAKSAARAYKNALHLFPANKNEWIPEVITCSSLENTSIDAVFSVVERFKELTEKNDSWRENRMAQDQSWLKSTLKDLILEDYFGNSVHLEELKTIEQKVQNGEMSSFEGAVILFEKYKNEGRV